jgi:predicted alpha/beta hydrolase family esterase
MPSPPFLIFVSLPVFPSLLFPLAHSLSPLQSFITISFLNSAQLSSAMKRILVLPGLHNSGSKHWQTLWETLQPFPNCHVVRIERSNWSEPNKDVWETELIHTLNHHTEDTYIVAHSLGCLSLALLSSEGVNIKGALFVAPPNPNRPDFPKDKVSGFTCPIHTVNYPSIMVGSTNDPYASIEFTESLAKTLGCTRFVNVGPLGHINGDSGLEEWKFGIELMNELLRMDE